MKGLPDLKNSFFITESSKRFGNLVFLLHEFNNVQFLEAEIAITEQ